MANLTKEEEKLMDVSEEKARLKKSIKEPFFYYWTKDKFLKTFTHRGYKEGKGLKLEDNTGDKRLPRWKQTIKRMRWYMPIIFLIVGFLVFLGMFYLNNDLPTKDLSQMFNDLDGESGEIVWYGKLFFGAIEGIALAIWFGFYYGFEFLCYIPYRREEMKKKSVIQVQTENTKKNREKYGTFLYKDLLPNMGPGKMFNITVLDNPTALHDNMGWIVKCGITKDPAEISMARKGLITRRMWEERPKDLIEKYRAAFNNSGGVPDKNYIYYVISNSIDKLHCFSEGDTGSGKTEAYASPESIFILRHVSHPSVLFTCKPGDEEATVAQAKCLDINVQHIMLNAPGRSATFNPLFLPYIYHKLKRQLKYCIKPVPMNITPWDWENKYDIEIRQKDIRAINYIEDISTKEELLEELAKYTDNKNITDLCPNWQDPNISLNDLVNIYKSWNDKKYMIVDIKKHFLITDKLSYWTDAKKKATTSWYRCGNWVFETIDEFNTKREKLYSMVESEFQGSVESVITNVMNEEKNTSTDAFWNNQVRLFLKMFVGVFFDLVEMGDFSNNQITMSDAFFNLPTVCTWLNKYCESAEKMKELAETYADLIPTIEKYKSNMVFPDQTFQSITGSVNAITQYYSSTSELLPIICRNEFNPLDFGLHQTLLCITTNNNEDSKANVLLKDVAGQVLNACNFLCNNYAGEGGKNTMLRPVRVVADEAGSGTPIPWASINAIATKGRSQKMLEGLYYQTTKQIQTQYPKVQGAEDILFGNLALKRCIKASAEDSLKKWESILGKGFATTLSDEDKKQELAGASQENPYFPAEYIRNKPMWNSLIKIGEMKTIDVASCPIYPTYFKKQLFEEAKKHTTRDYKKRVTTTTNFWTDSYLDLAEALSFLTSAVIENYNFAIQFNQLETSIGSDDDGNQVEMSLPFKIRFSPASNLQNYTSTMDNFNEWDKKYNQENLFANNDQISQAQQVANVTDDPFGLDDDIDE